jgi:hypothetical protein
MLSDREGGLAPAARFFDIFLRERSSDATRRIRARIFEENEFGKMVV